MSEYKEAWPASSKFISVEDPLVSSNEGVINAIHV
jgi:hypothetical protein